MRITLVSSATIDRRARRTPDLRRSDARRRGCRPPIEGTRNQVANPTVPLPFPAEEVVRGLDAVDRHAPAPRPSRHSRRGTAAARRAGFLPTRGRGGASHARTRCAASRRRARVGRAARSRAHRRATGAGAIAELLAPVSGFVLDDLYLAGDTVWYEGVEETIARHRPRVAVVNAGGAEFVEGGLIVMGADDVREVVARVPRSSPCTWRRSTTASSSASRSVAPFRGVLVRRTARRMREVVRGRLSRLLRRRVNDSNAYTSPAQSSPTPMSTASGGSSGYAPTISSRTSSRTFVTSVSGHLEQELVVHLQHELRAPLPLRPQPLVDPDHRDLDDVPFEPCMTKFTATRSPKPRVWRFIARSSGTGRRRPSKLVA